MTGYNDAHLLALAQDFDGPLLALETSGSNTSLCAVGLKALQAGGPDNLVVADTNNSFLGAVFGNPTTAEATALLKKALSSAGRITIGITSDDFARKSKRRPINTFRKRKAAIE